MLAFIIHLVGIVQGVGFRPFIYRIATKSGVYGYVKNLGGAEVEIYIEGSKEGIEKFFKFFYKEAPSVMIIEKLRVVKTEPKGYREFKILKSERKRASLSMIPPDFAICDDCLKEVLNPEDSRRYKYPFNSCAFCGPRYSMMFTIPWDRENTSMIDFPLCRECLQEYEDPENIRRFHAEGISCSKCGPRVYLMSIDGELIDTDDPIREAAKLVDEGYIVGIKGIGGYHIAALASDDDVVMRLRIRKSRPQQPFAVMALDLEVASKLVYLDDKSVKLLTSIQRPIVLLPIRETANISKFIAPGLKHLGIFLPYTALHYLFLSYLKDHFSIMTSGNPHGSPMCTDESCAFSKLKGIVDYLLVHNRRIVNRVDDSVVRFTLNEPILLRRGRGYAPMWIRVKTFFKKPIIAFGALLQNTGALGIEDKVVSTQFIGDCDEYETLLDLDKYLTTLMRMYRVDVNDCVLACDLHPEYSTTKLAETWSKEYNLKLIRIQHHWSHIVSTMVDREIDEEVIGIAIDGIGYGVDGNAWGGEVMRCTYSYFERRAHLRYVIMPGGDIATIYPARMLVAYLMNFMNENEVKSLFRKLNIVEKGFKFGELELNLTISQVVNGKGVLTSSTGRVLDAVSTLLGVCFERTYEGEPAIKLEAHARPVDEIIDVPIINEEDIYIIDTVKIFEKILELMGKYDSEELAYMAQYSLGYALGEVAVLMRNRKHRYVILSGGAAVNNYIVKGIKDVVEQVGLKVVLPRRVPPNDGGLSLGQVVIANELMKDA